MAAGPGAPGRERWRRHRGASQARPPHLGWRAVRPIRPSHEKRAMPCRTKRSSGRSDSRSATGTTCLRRRGLDDHRVSWTGCRHQASKRSWMMHVSYHISAIRTWLASSLSRRRCTVPKTIPELGWIRASAATAKNADWHTPRILDDQQDAAIFLHRIDLRGWSAAHSDEALHAVA